ncbi:MAG: PmoA family protein [Acidobacteria bacterium]|nr:PmoA family protein [Acidobacteriota bacterium]
MNRRNFLLALPAAATAAAPAWQLRQEPGQAQVHRGGKLFAALHIGPEWDKPFLYPLRAADGTDLSRGWPVAKRQGDTEDHAWHRGLWWGHGVINGEDYWREIKGKTGFIRTSRVSGRRVGDGFRIEAKHMLRTRANQTVAGLNTAWTLAESSNERTIDFAMTLRATQELRFGDTDDGGFGFRLREEFREERGAKLTNAEGKTGAKQIWGRPSAWTHYEALVDGKPYGAAILSHPGNLRHPAGWHARNYGLNSANPFAASSFAEEKGGTRGEYVLPAKATLRLRYRVILHSGACDIAERYQRWIRA